MDIVLEDKHKVVMKENVENGEIVYTIIDINVSKFTRKKDFKTLFIDYKKNDGSVINYSAEYQDGFLYQTSLYDAANDVRRTRTNLGVTVDDSMMGMGCSVSPLREPGIMDKFIKLASNAEEEYHKFKEQGFEK